MNTDHYMALNIAFHLLPIWLQTLVAINSESSSASYPSFCMLPPKVAVLFSLTVLEHLEKLESGPGPRLGYMC